MNKTQKSDPRRQLSPEGSSVSADSAGFSLIHEQQIIYQLQWSNICQIVGYTRFRAMKPELCLAFAYSRRRNDQVVVHHDVSGWEQLCTILQDVFPQADRDWRSKAAHDHTNMDQYLPVASVVPIFTVNPTTVWSQ
jgi:hypothetical protein